MNRDKLNGWILLVGFIYSFSLVFVFEIEMNQLVMTLSILMGFLFLIFGLYNLFEENDYTDEKEQKKK